MRGDHVKLVAVFLQQALDVLLHAAHNIAGQGDLHELQHGDVVVVADLCAIEALVVRAQVPKVGEYVVGPEDLMRSDLPVVFCPERGLEQIFADGILIAPLHELEEVGHIPEGQVIGEHS